MCVMNLPQTQKQGVIVMQINWWCKWFVTAAAVAWMLPVSNAAACAVGEPCILSIRSEGARLVIVWNDTEARDHYNVRWGSPGLTDVQVEVSGGRFGSLAIPKVADRRYSISVQGCSTPLIGRASCTRWVEQTVVACGLRGTPCGSPLNSGLVRIRSGADKCLDVHAPDQDVNGGKVQVWDCNGTNQQTFILDGDTVKTKGGKCLDVHAPDQLTDGGRVQVWDCNGASQQIWRVEFNARRITNGGRKCLDVHAPEQRANGGRVQVWDCNGSLQQIWTAETVGVVAY